MEESNIVSEASLSVKKYSPLNVTFRIFISREINAKKFYNSIHLYTLTGGKKTVI